MAIDPVPRVQTISAYELTVVEHDPLSTSIRASGELDIAAQVDLARALQRQEGVPGRTVHLDLSRVTFLDCSCVGVLVRSHHSLLQLRGRLVLTGMGACVGRVVSILGLDRTLFIVPDGQDPFGAGRRTTRHARGTQVPKQRR